MSLMALAVAMSPEEARSLGIVLVMVTAFLSAVLYPIARAYARRLEGSTSTAALKEELGEVYERLEELQRGQERIAELEGRLDFAERLLAQRREPERIPGKADAP